MTHGCACKEIGDMLAFFSFLPHFTRPATAREEEMGSGEQEIRANDSGRALDTG
jgi:hypothetical protein